MITSSASFTTHAYGAVNEKARGRSRPVEMATSKFKTLRRKAAVRTMAALWDRIGDLHSAFTLRNAPTTSLTPDMVQLERRML
jgi:hypothetical protein